MLALIQDSTIAQWVSRSLWAFPIVLTLHVVGLSTCIGMSWMLGARTFGFGRGIPIKQLGRIMTPGWLGVAITAFSGILLFAGQATAYAANSCFRLKIALIVAALASTIALVRLLRAGEEGWRARLCGGFSAALWLAALIAGRMVGYFGVGGG